MKNNFKTAEIAKTAKIGKDCVLGHNVVILDNVQIGDNAYIGHNVVIHEGTRIGNNAYIDDGSILGRIPRSGASARRKVRETIPPLEIGDDCVIGAGALVTQGKKIPPGMLAMGSPAKVIRPLTNEEKAYLKTSAANYVADGADYLLSLGKPQRAEDRK